MFEKLHARHRTQKILALLIGIPFGFLLQRGGATEYKVILEQLLLKDFTVVKIMLSAVITGMAGVYFLRARGLARLHPKDGSLGSILPGGIVFGVGFALLGYCPGTLAAAAGSGKLDALLAGIPGMVLGTWLYALMYPLLNRLVLPRGPLGNRTLPEVLGVSPGVVVPVMILLLAAVLVFLESLS